MPMKQLLHCAQDFPSGGLGLCPVCDQKSRVMFSRLMYIMTSLFNPKYNLFQNLTGLFWSLNLTNQVLNLTRRWLLLS